MLLGKMLEQTLTQRAVDKLCADDVVLTFCLCFFWLLNFTVVLSRMEGEGEKKWPGFTGIAYPEVFNTIPPQPQQRKPGHLSEQQVKKFFDEVCSADNG